jgi:hypothetical protein
MARLAAAIATLSLGLALCPMPWLFVGLGLSLVALTAGWTTFHTTSAPGCTRLLGVGAAALALLAFALAGMRVVLSIAAAARLERMLG